MSAHDKAIRIAENAELNQGRWTVHEVSGREQYNVLNTLKKYYPWLEVKTSRLRGTIYACARVRSDEPDWVEYQGKRRYTPSCACGYDDCPCCGQPLTAQPPPVRNTNRCSYCGSYYCTRHDHEDPSQLDQVHTWNSHPIEHMSQVHLENAIDYITRVHGRTGSPVQVRMRQVLQAKRTLMIDEQGSPQESQLRS